MEGAGQTTTGTPAAEGSRREIRRLEPLLVNQIAAGEVIERPASVVKELVENAIDAGSTRIVVELEEGGVERVRVTDDGRGIPPGQLPLALAPHATSKISAAEDLDRIATMGFRGEALASIASVSRLTITSKARSERTGATIEASGPDVSEVRPAACPPGTTVDVRTLFFNTPARRKFLRTAQTERTRCTDWIKDLALAHPAVGFRCVADGNVVFDLPAGQSPVERTVAVLGNELRDQLVEVSVDRFDDERGILIWGLVGLPAIARGSAKGQHLFLNGRTIKDSTVQHALREAYRGLIEPGRYPTAVLMLEMSPAAVDVNVHPAKLEVRFRDRSMVHKAVNTGVREALRRADLTPSATGRMPGGSAASGSSSGFARTPRGDAIAGSGVPTAGAEPKPSDVAATREFIEYLSHPAATTPSTEAGDDYATRAHAEASSAEPGVDPVPPTMGVRRVERVLQAHDSYLIVEDDDGLLLIDQHALHERIVYERLLGRIREAGRLESQQLLTPVVVEAEPEQLDRLDGIAPMLETIGMELRAIGPRSAGVYAVPTLFVERHADVAQVAADLLATLASSDGVGDGEEALHEVLDTMACKAAVKAGDPLDEGEIAELLSQRGAVERSGSCPHGRATTVRLSRADLDKLFDRR